MKIKLSTAGLVIGALLLPAAGYTADQPSKPTTTEKIKENVGDATITAKIKTEFAKDKQVDAMHLNVDTDNKGVVTLRGMAKSQAEADKAVAIAKATQGVTMVKNEMQIASAASTDGSMAKKTSTAGAGKSDQPIDDTVITTRVKARMMTDNLVDAGNIHVKTVNGVVKLSGTAKSKAEANKAVAIAREVPDVKSVKNNIQVTAAVSSTGNKTSKSGDSTAKSSDQPVDDTLITTRVKARMATDKQVSATNISVKTVNGVVELSGTAKSKAEADQAVAIVRNVDGVKSVKNDIQVTAAVPATDSMARSSTTAEPKRSDQPVDDTLITTRVKAKMVSDKLVDAGNIHVKTVNGVVELSGTAKSKAEAEQAVALARRVDYVKSVKNEIQVK